MLLDISLKLIMERELIRERVKAVQDQLDTDHTQNFQAFRSFKNETFGIGACESTKDNKNNTFQKVKVLINENSSLEWRQQFEAKNPELAAKLRA